MAKIVDPDQLNRDTEIVFVTSGSPRTIQLLVAGNLDDSAPGKTSGVTEQAVMSKCKELWKSEADLNKLKFPFDVITATKMDLVRDWDWADQQTKDLIRDGGWSLRDASGISEEEYFSVITLGAFFEPASDLAYVQQIAGFDQSVISLDKAGETNEPVKIYGDSAHGNVNYRTFFKIFLREQGKLYAESDLLVDQDLTTIDYTVFKIPLENSTDIKVTTSDSDISTLAPYTGMAIDYLDGVGFSTWAISTVYPALSVVQSAGGRWFRTTAGGTSDGDDSDLAGGSDTGVTWVVYSGEEQIGANYYAYNRIVDGNNATVEEIYEFCQWSLRQASDINDDVAGDGHGTINGNIAIPLCTFLGDTLQTNGGTVIRNFDTNDTNRIEQFDITVDGGGIDATFETPVTSTVRLYPFVSAGTIVFNQTAIDDPVAEWAMYFANAGGNLFDTTNAIIVNNNSATPLTAETISGNVTFDFDYDGNNQGGRTPGTDADIVIVAIGLSGAQWVEAEFTITRAVGLSFPVNPALERNYSNP